MGKFALVSLGLLSTISLSYYCVQLTSPIIESDIQTRTQHALKNIGLGTISPRVSGRDVVLAGFTSQSRKIQHAKLWSESVPGVRHVQNHVQYQDSKKKACQRKFNAYLSQEKIRFGLNSDHIREKSIPLLGRLSEAVKECPEFHIEISGHTDNSGKEEFNLYLSQSRAQAVRQHIIREGVAPHLLSAVGYGSRFPIKDNSMAWARAFNRRIEFNIKEK